MVFRQVESFKDFLHFGVPKFESIQVVHDSLLFFSSGFFWKMSDVSNCSGAEQRSERCRFQGFPILRNECMPLLLSDIFCNWDCLKLWWIPFLVWKGTFRSFHRFPQAKEMLWNCNKQVNAKASERCSSFFLLLHLYALRSWCGSWKKTWHCNNSRDKNREQSRVDKPLGIS